MSTEMSLPEIKVPEKQKRGLLRIISLHFPNYSSIFKKLRILEDSYANINLILIKTTASQIKFTTTKIYNTSAYS